ncbi:restriction endonuclease subunit S [Bifidobacterium sp. UMB1197]|nr:restriction endonuclease subunit S [Bifidobacterium sp. UMB1197]
MSRLDELIQKLCPNGVEYKTIGTICETLKKATLKKGELKSEGYPVINSGRTLYGYYDKYNNEGPAFTVAARGEYAAFVNYFDKRFWAGGLCYPYKSKYESKTSTKFIYYSLKNIQQRIRDGIVAEGSIPALNKSDFENIKLPVPPLEVQREIVRILDNFTELTAELTENLTAELTDRKKQYEYYRDTLLTFDDNNPLHSLISHYCPNGVEYKKIGDIATDVFRGYGIKKDQVTSTGIPCVRYGEIYTKYNLWFDSCFSHTDESLITNKKYFEHGDILFAITGESVEDIAKSCAYVGNEKCLAGGDIVVVKHNQNPKYLSYALSTTDARLQKSSGKVKSKVVHASTESIKGIILPVPPLEVQNQIVQILDRFDALCNDLTQGLPAEIEARRKQYEYYRNLLLAFKRA